jgi:hypothetical protein
MNFIISEIAENARAASNFYAGIAQIIEGDEDQDGGFKFLAEVFGNSVDERDGKMDVGFLELYAIGTYAGLYRDLDDADEIHKRQHALVALLRRAAKLSSEQIEALVPTGQSWEQPDETAKPNPDRGAALTME